MMTSGQFTLRVIRRLAPSPSVQPQVPLRTLAAQGLSLWHQGGMLGCPHRQWDAITPVSLTDGASLDFRLLPEN